MKKKIFEFIKFQSFQPGLASIFLNPFYFIRKELSRNIRQLAPKLTERLMDFGCGRKPYQNLFLNTQTYIGVDIEQTTGHDHTNSLVDVYYDGKNIPFEDHEFDSVFCSEVLEHVFNADDILRELNRVLKIDGQILITVPFCWNEHEIPYDFGRYSSFGLKYMLEKHGFELLESRKSGHFSEVIFQLISLYIFEIFGFIKFKPLRYILSLLLIAPLNIVGTLICYVLPRNHTLYFNNIILAKKISDPGQGQAG